MKRLEGKVAIITGGSSGIGLASAIEYQKEGAKIVIFARNESALKEAEEILCKTGNVLAICGDVTKSKDVESMLKETEDKLGKIDILLLNAGVTKMCPIEAVTETFFDEIMDVNFKAPFFFIQKALPHMNNNGSIVLISSVGNRLGQHSFSVYAASKAALRSLALTLSRELILSRGIRVNAIAPGMIDTPLLQKAGFPDIQSPQMKYVLETFNPMKRAGLPHEIAKAALFLASDDSSYMLGEEIIIDGGLSLLGSV